MYAPFPDTPVDQWLAEYKAHHRHLLDADPEFARWLDGDYVPVAGGWQY